MQRSKDQAKGVEDVQLRQKLRERRIIADGGKTPPRPVEPPPSESPELAKILAKRRQKAEG